MSIVFGTRAELDTYLLAVAGPTLIATIAGDLLYTLLLPELAAAHARGDVTMGWDVVLSASAAVAAVTVGYAAVWAIAIHAAAGARSPNLLPLGLAASPLIFFGGLATAIATVLIAKGRYVAVSIRVPFASLTALVTFLVISHFDRSGLALVLSVLAGSIASAILTLVVMIRADGRPRLSLSPQGVAAALRPLARATAGQLIASVSGQALVPVERIVGYWHGPGVISTLNYGRVLVSPPLLVGQSIATAAYVRFVEEGLDSRSVRYTTLGRGIAMVTFLLFPLSVLMGLLAGPLVQVVYRRGAFDDQAVMRTTVVATILAAAVLPIAIVVVVTRFLYAQRASGLVACASVAALAIYILLAAALSTLLGYIGLAAASTIYYVVLMLILLGLAVRHSPTGLGFLPGARLLKIAGASVGSGLAISAVARLADGSHGLKALAVVALATVLGSAVYLGAALLLRIPELEEALSTGRRALSRWPG